jgi:1-deoxy-D-xylulose-5-phosphate reductoisomerase
VGGNYMKNLSVLGVTGSIGTQTLDVIRKQPDDFKLISISANSNYNKVISIIKEFMPQYVVMTDIFAFNKVKEYCFENRINIEVLQGMEGLIHISSMKEIDMVVTSIVGMVGLEPTLSAIRAGKDIALANKETLVVAGELVMKEAERCNVKILPVDSEHGAIFQCLNVENPEAIKRILLTASGGPFRGMKKDDLVNITSAEALKHPKWNMGKKISIDSSTLMNKGLEVIEAHWLFGCDYENIEVVVHPQSIVHSMVEFVDGSVIAQLADTDMRLPIQYAMNYPERKKQIVNSLDFKKIGALTFEEPDMGTFPCLKLAFDAGRSGMLMPTIMNAANEICVDLFLNERIGFYQISDIIEECMLKFDYRKAITVENVINMDLMVREYIKSLYK